MATLLKVLNNLADIKSAGGVALRVRTQGPRMIHAMRARRFNEPPQRDYVRDVRMFAAFLGRSPDTAAKEDLRRFQLQMAKQQMSAGSINAAIAALRFFFTVTLERPDLVLPLTTVNKPRRAPVA